MENININNNDRRKKKKFIKAKDAAVLLKITKDDFYIICSFFNQKPLIGKHKYIFNSESKKRTQYSKDKTNKIMKKNTDRGIIKDNRENSKGLETESDIYPINFVTQIYNSKIYKHLLKNLKINTKNEKYNKEKQNFVNYNFDEQVLDTYKNFNGVLKRFSQCLSCLFLFSNKNLFKKIENKQKFTKNNKEFFQEVLQNSEKDLTLNDQLLEVFIENLLENNSLKFCYPTKSGYYFQVLFLKKSLMFFIPGSLEIKSLTPILFYNFKVHLSKLKLVLCKIYGVDKLENKIEHSTNNIFNVKNKSNSLLDGKKFSIEKNVEFQNILRFLVEIQGGEVLEGCENVLAINVEQKQEDKKYYHPQYVFDLFNKKKDLKAEDYLLGNVIPELFYPFEEILEEKKFSKLTEKEVQHLSLSKKVFIEEKIEEENKEKFYFD